MDTQNPFEPLQLEELRTSAQLHVDDSWQPIIPVPEGAPELTPDIIKRFAPNGSTLTDYWLYLNTSGKMIMCVARFDFPENGKSNPKQIRPISFCHGPNQRREWRSKYISDPRPLYNLDQVFQRQDAKILVVEGEKAAKSAARLFSDYVVVTSPGGGVTQQRKRIGASLRAARLRFGRTTMNRG